MANPSGGSRSTLLQKPPTSKPTIGRNQPAHKHDEIEFQDSTNNDLSNRDYSKNSIVGWICCAPCIWLRTSATVHRFAIAAATLLVTALLVASPILFLISTAPSQLPRDCYPDGDKCLLKTSSSSLECTSSVCRVAALSIQAKLNWKIDPCNEFKEFSCSNASYDDGRIVSFWATRSAQESVDIQMQQLLQYNTTSGTFRKLGRLYESCLRQSLNSTTIRKVFEKLGGYLPIGALGPSSIAPLITKIYELGPTSLLDIYYDLSYGRHPHVLLIVGGPKTSGVILENKVRWTGPKAPFYEMTKSNPKLLDELLETFLPDRLSYAEEASEKDAITGFVQHFTKIRVQHSRRGFWDSTILYNSSSVQSMFPIFNWTALLPSDWNGPIVIRNPEYFKALEELLEKYPRRVTHNSLLLLFALGILPHTYPDPVSCTKATVWALPDISSALFMAQHATDDLQDFAHRAEIMFKLLKAHLKRAPSLKGAALVKLSSLKIQTQPWDGFKNFSVIKQRLDYLKIGSDDYFENVLELYKKNKLMNTIPIPERNFHNAWAYPVIPKIFYDTLSHSIVVPLSAILVPYFDAQLPSFLQYASVGVAIAKEILRSITKAFEEKAMTCVPQSVNIFSNHSRMDILIQSGGMQISYHSMLSLNGPGKGMEKLPGLNLTPKQIFFVVSAQQLCAEYSYAGIDSNANDFSHILSWLIAQGKSSIEVFKCSSSSVLNSHKTCNVL